MQLWRDKKDRPYGLITKLPAAWEMPWRLMEDSITALIHSHSMTGTPHLTTLSMLNNLRGDSLNYENNALRYAAYRQFTWWIYNLLAKEYDELFCLAWFGQFGIDIRTSMVRMSHFKRRKRKTVVYCDIEMFMYYNSTSIHILIHIVEKDSFDNQWSTYFEFYTID